MREIEVVPARRQRIEIVAADAALHLGKARLDFRGFARAEREQIAGERLERRRSGMSERSALARPKCARVPSARTASTDSTLSRVVP
jgi:hypothetical protein